MMSLLLPPSQSYTEVLTPSTLERDLVWKYGLYRGNQIKMRIRLPMQETQETHVRPLSWEGPLEKGEATPIP